MDYKADYVNPLQPGHESDRVSGNRALFANNKEFLNWNNGGFFLFSIKKSVRFSSFCSITVSKLLSPPCRLPQIFDVFQFFTPFPADSGVGRQKTVF